MEVMYWMIVKVHEEVEGDVLEGGGGFMNGTSGVWAVWPSVWASCRT